MPQGTSDSSLSGSVLPDAILLDAPAWGVPRRVPRQARSRRRVEAILDATSRLVLEEGVEGLTTRGIADAADVPVASLYQYFSDKEDVLLALVQRDMAEMDAQLLADLVDLDPLTLPSLVESAMRSFARVYDRSPAFVEIWLRGRTNPALRECARTQNDVVATNVRQFAEAAGMLTREMPHKIALFAVEVSDRIFQLAYEHDRTGDQELLDEGITMVTTHLAPYSAQVAATPPAPPAPRRTTD